MYKKSVFKKVPAIILSALLLLQPLSGCGSQKGEQGNIGGSTVPAKTSEQTAGTEPNIKSVPDYLNTESVLPVVKEGNDITIKIAHTYTDGFISDPKDIWFWKFVEKFCGFKVEVESILPEGAAERVTLMFTSGELPDMMFNFGFDTSKIVTYGVDGKQLLPVNDYITDEIMPNYKALMEKYPELKTICTANDGKMYSFGRKFTADNPGGNWRPGINQKWLSKLNLKSPETIDEFIDVMRKFKAAKPSDFGVDKIIPMGGSYSYESPFFAFYNGMGYLLPNYGWLKSNAGSGAVIAIRNGKVALPALDDIYGDYVALCKLAYDEGLVSKDFFTKDGKQAEAEWADSKIGYTNQTPEVIGVGKTEKYLAHKPLTSKWNDTPVTPSDDPFGMSDLYISAKTKYPELCCKFVDIYFSEYQLLINEGPDKGSEYSFGDKYVQYEYDKDQNKFVIAKSVIDAGENGWTNVCKYLQPTYTAYGDISVDNLMRYNEKVRKMPVVNKDVIATLEQRLAFRLKDPEEWYNAHDISYIQNIMPYRKTTYPRYTYRTADEIKMLEDLRTVFEPYIIEQFALFVTGGRPMSEIGKFQEELKKMGADKYLQFHIDEYARVNSSK